jgi:hypothetical protein
MCPPISTGPQDGGTTAAPRDSAILALFVSRYYRVQIEPPTSNVLPPIVLRLSWQTDIWQTCRRSALGQNRRSKANANPVWFTPESRHHVVSGDLRLGTMVAEAIRHWRAYEQSVPRDARAARTSSRAIDSARPRADRADHGCGRRVPRKSASILRHRHDAQRRRRLYRVIRRHDGVRKLRNVPT